MKYEKGNLILKALNGEFDVIAHGCNCFNRQKSGIAKQMVDTFHTDIFSKESKYLEGDINKLGTIDYMLMNNENNPNIVYPITVVNCYTQYKIAKFNQFDYNYTTTEIPVDYEAITLCMRKINHLFKGKRVGLPKIGAGKAKGDWNIISQVIEKELKDCNVTICEL